MNDPHDRDSRERYHLLADMSPDGMLIHDGERIVMANAAAARHARAADLSEVVGLPIHTILHPPYLRMVEQRLLDRDVTAAVAPVVRDTLHRLDGSDLDVEVQANAFLDGDRFSAHVVFRDITGLLLAEQALHEESERVRWAAHQKAVGQLAGGIAHQLNNAMQMVLWNCDTVLSNSRVPDDCLDDLRGIRVATLHAAEVTKQLLAFSRRSQIHPRVVALARVVDDAKLVLRGLTGDRVTLVINDEDAPRVLVDPAQLEQVIQYLALNAREAMPRGGTLTITTRECDVRGTVVASDGAFVPPGRYGVLDVTDTGSGIDAARQRTIFEPFYTTKASEPGRGLGLSAAEGMLAQNKGFITLTSAPGEGATFTVYLPLVSEPAPSAVPLRAD